MIAVALLDPVATRGAIEAVLPAQSVSQSLVRLGRLSNCYNRKSGKQITSTPARHRASFITAAKPLFDERQQLHRRAGAYFESEAKDWLYAASHFLEAKEDSHAARLATMDLWRFINQGRARQLAQVLDRFTQDRLDRLEWATVGVSRGEVHQFLHDVEQARSGYESVLATLPPAE